MNRKAPISAIIFFVLAGLLLQFSDVKGAPDITDTVAETPEVLRPTLAEQPEGITDPLNSEEVIVIEQSDTVATKTVNELNAENGRNDALAEASEKKTDGSSQPVREEVSRLREELTQAPDVRNIISIGKIFWAVIFTLLGYLIIRAISGILSLIAERKVKHRTTIRRVLPVVKIVGWAFVVYIIINGIFQPPAETIFAFFASVGVAIGFASQDLLKNIFGGLMILFDKPFQIGDKIESGKYYGEVREVGLRSTRVVTPDDSIVTIPNSEMMNQSISNANSSENNCQVVAEFFLPVTVDTRRVRQIATEAAQVSKYVYLNKPIFVEYSNVLVPKGSFLKMRLKAYVLDVRDEFPFQSEMTEIVLRELRKEGLLEGL